MTSPYKSLPPKRWLDITHRLVNEHPLKAAEIVDVVLSAWNSIFASRMGTKKFQIGKEIFPKPQIMGFFLHELIPLELGARHPKSWRGEQSSGDKDIVYIPDNKFSIEVKTSSNPSHIFGNRSYAQETTTNKKSKTGYYLAVNFQKFSTTVKRPNILLIRFGWLDSADWIGQKAATGQQSRLQPEIENNKLLEIYKST
jgi:hypothetical protein